MTWGWLLVFFVVFAAYCGLGLWLKRRQRLSDLTHEQQWRAHIIEKSHAALVEKRRKADEEGHGE